MKIITYNLNIISKYLFKHFTILLVKLMNLLRWSNAAKKSYNPIAIFHPKKVLGMLESWNKYLPEIIPYYAIKSFSNKHILDTISNSKYRVGFDIASRKEHQMVKNYNQPIVFSHTIKSKCDIEYAKENSVRPLMADSIEELQKIRSIYPDCPIIWRIKSFEQDSKIRFNKKFGADDSDTIFALINYPEIIGMSFHVGSNCSNMNSYIKTIDTILNRYYGIAAANGNKLEIIDIGGGFTNKEDLVMLKQLGEHSFSRIKHLGIKCIAEPGRLFSKDSLSLLTKIIAIKKDVDRMDIYINDSIYNSFSGKLFDKQQFSPVPLYNNHKYINCRIWGNTCDSADIIVESVMLPIPKVDDVLLWENMGAYSIASSINGFNGFGMAQIVNEEEQT